MRQANIDKYLEVLGNSKSKITERRDALAALKTKFANQDVIDNYHLNSKGSPDPTKWSNVFSSLFQAIEIAKNDLLKATGKSTTTSDAAQRRLEEIANTVRWFAERTVHLMNNKIMNQIVKGLLHGLVYKGELLAPVSLHYVKALRCFADYKPHLDNLQHPHWIRIIEIGFNTLLDDPVNAKLQNDVESTPSRDADDSDLFDEDEPASDDSSSAHSKKRRRTASPSVRSRAKKRARSIPIQTSVSREQLEFMSMIAKLLDSSSTPILSSSYSYLPSSLLARFRRFLDHFGSDTSLVHDYVAALSSTLSHLSLNRIVDVSKFAHNSWDKLLGLWRTKNKQIKEGLVSVLTVLLPFIASENQPYRVSGLAFKRGDAIRKLLQTVEAVDGLSLDSLRLEIADASLQPANSAFISRAFRYGPTFDGNQALTWAILELQAECLVKLLLLSESMHPPSTPAPSQNQDRFTQHVDSMTSLMKHIQQPTPSKPRSTTLQILLFVIDRHWTMLHRELQNKIVDMLLQFVSVDDGVMQSWILLCFAAVASSANPSCLPEGTWLAMWTSAVRRANVPVVSRAACHAACSILAHTRSYNQQDDLPKIPLASNQVLQEIESLAKDLTVQGPPYPYDSVCAFLVTCLRVSSQDMHLYRMQLEEKVLSWLVDCWQITGFRNKSRSLLVVKDFLSLLEGICGHSKTSDFKSQIPLPEGQIVDTLVDEARTRVIKSYILDAHLPSESPFEEKEKLSSSPLTAFHNHDDRSLSQPRGRERRVTAFLLKTLERLKLQWNENSVHPTAETVRHMLDMGVTALCFESTLVLNGMQADRRLIRLACDLISSAAVLLPDPRWTVSERELIILGFDPLTRLDDPWDESLTWNAMLSPDVGSGIQYQLLNRLTSHTTSNDLLCNSRANFLRVVWHNADLQDIFNTVGDVMHTVLRKVLGHVSSDNSMDRDTHDDFEPIRTGSGQRTDEQTADLSSRRSIMDSCIAFLTTGPALQSLLRQPARDKELIEDILNCADPQPRSFLTAVPLVLRRSRQGILNITVASLDVLLDKLAGLLQTYLYSRNNQLLSVVVEVLTSTLKTWASFGIEETLENVRQLCYWLSRAYRKGKIGSWMVRDSLARFIDQYLVHDATEDGWGLPTELEEPQWPSPEQWSPSSLLPEFNRDEDMRVRFRAAVISARLFAHARHQHTRLARDVYFVIKENLTIDPEDYEHMLSRILSLGNSMVAASATRRGAYWHLLETCFFSPRYSAHIEIVLRSVSQRLGMTEFSCLFETYASQVAFSIRQLGKDADFLRFPPRMLGYRDRKECVVANFRSFAPTNIWNEAQDIFESHCKIVYHSDDSNECVLDGLRDCFGDLLGYQIVALIEQIPEANMMESLKQSFPFSDEEFDWRLAQNVDSITASILRSFWDIDPNSIDSALTKYGHSERSVEIFKSLVTGNPEGRKRDGRDDLDMEIHEPNLPAFPARTILKALNWLRSQVSTAHHKATSYHILHQLLADVNRSPLVVEQRRLMDSICLWIATHSSDFRDTALLHTLIHGIAAHLGQSDLTRPAQYILTWAFDEYRTMKTRHSHIPDILVRIACTAYDFSQMAYDPKLVILGEELLQWIDYQTLELHRVSSLSIQVMRALPAWPHQPSPQLAQQLQSVTEEHLSSVLGDHRVSSSKFRLVRRLQQIATDDGLDKDHFTETDFWRLKECIPSLGQLQAADVNAFANLLYLSKGQIGSFRNESSGSTSSLARYRRKAWKEAANMDRHRKDDANLAQNDTKIAREPIILMLLAMIQSVSPSQSYAAYNTLRLIRSTETEASQLVEPEHKMELEYLTIYQRSPIRRPCRDVKELITCDTYLDSVDDFPRWIADVTTLLSDVLLSSDDAFYAQITPILKSDTEFAEQVLPILVYIILVIEKESASDTNSRDTLTVFFTSVLSEGRTCVRSLRCVIDVVLHLRHFARDPPPKGRANTTKNSTGDALSYNKWLSVDFSLLSRCSITCGAYTTALLFLELAAEEGIGSSNTSNEILYEIYRHIDEPDGFYGIHDADLHQNLIRRFHHENQWERAFRFHGAAIEAGDSASHAGGLVKSFHSFGFDHLANDMLQAAFTTRGTDSTHDLSYRLAWRTENWDLPETSEHSGASIYSALRAIYRERDDRIINETIQRCLFAEMNRLRTLGSEDFAEIREVTHDVMCLHEIAKWRQSPIQVALSSRDLSRANWNDFISIESDFDFPILESVLATRISLIRSVRQKEERQRIGELVTPFHQQLVDIEAQCLVRLSKAAREANEAQVALNSIFRAFKLEKPPCFDVFEEFASVLWSQKEEQTAIEYIGRLPSAGWGNYVRDTVENERKALLLARLGSWSSAACMKTPEDIKNEYFKAACDLLDHKKSSSTHATVYHQCAIFAEGQYYDIVKSPDARRWKIYVERKRQEIEALSKELQGLDSKSDYAKTLRNRQYTAQKLMVTDAESFQRHNDIRDGFLVQAIEMYSRCLRASDAHDQDAPIRLCSLWFANFEDNRPDFQKVVQRALQRVPSRKFVFLSHQLSARISAVAEGSPATTAQASLQDLVLRMCREHPFHILYQVYCLQPPDPPPASGGRRQSQQHQPTPLSPLQMGRATAAGEIFNRLRADSAVSQHLRDVEQLCAACLEWAKAKMETGQRTISLSSVYKLSKISNMRVPVITHNTPVDPSMKYTDCPWIDHYEVKWSYAGGKNTPKIGICLGSDGIKYKQLFKGQGDDDLRQDAVMEQVFALVNGILHRDRETRRRSLNIREYKVIPLATQAGILEFVGSTLPLRECLFLAHKKYRPGERSTTQIFAEIKKTREGRYANRGAQEQQIISKYKEIQEEIKPVMRHFFTEKHKVPNAWFATRLDYSRSLATSSIVGHILGLGDRHTSNILMDVVSGQVVPIDLGIAFDQGKRLPVPELVPFRLTRDMVDGLGMSGTAGVFQRCAEETLRVLRDGSDVIMTILEVFKHDPLHSWTASETKIQQAQQGASATTTTTTTTTAETTLRLGIDIGIDMSSGSAEEEADRALSSVLRKLDKSLSVQTVVSQLVREATDVRNLALMFEGEGLYDIFDYFILLNGALQAGLRTTDHPATVEGGIDFLSIIAN
ncbi:hypothetical protein H0H92_010424 [Tricholoma furcatifolium]|nr:hypothetical protein H0H92_010424 [Tricholoma furcatifolium]